MLKKSLKLCGIGLMIYFIWTIIITFYYLFPFVKAPENKAYALQYVIDKKLPGYAVTEIDLDTLTHDTKQVFRKGYQYFSVLPNGNLILASLRSGFFLSDKLGLFHQRFSQKTNFASVTDPCPMVSLPYKNKLYVMVGGNYSGTLSIDVYDFYGNHLQYTKIHDNAMLSDKGFFLDVENDKLILFPSTMNMEPGDNFLISHKAVYDLTTYTVESLEPFYNNTILRVESIAINRPKNKVYVTSPVKTTYTDKNDRISKEVYILSYPDYKLLNKIMTPYKTQRIVYMENEEKLYIQGGTGFTIIDTKTEKVIKTMDMRVFRFARVNENKLAMSIMNTQLKKYVPDSLLQKVSEENLAIFDTRTDTFIQVIKGDFGPIGWNEFMFRN